MIATRDEATAAVLGAVLLSEAVLDTLLEERIRPAHFHRRDERAIYEAMLALRDAGEPIDILTLKARLEAAVGPGRTWPDVSVMRSAVDLGASATPAVGNVRAYCTIVRTEARFARAGEQLHRAGDRLEARDWQGLVTALADIDTLDMPPPTADQSGDFIAWYENDRKGIPLPFGELTEAVGLGGLQAGESTMLGGWPQHGKTILASQALLSAVPLGARCHEYANEMTGPPRTARLIASLTGIPVPRIAKRNLTKDDWRQVMRVLNALPYETTTTSGWLAEDYCREIRRHKWDLAVIDNVTNLPYGRVDEWDRACGMLNDAAEQAGTHLILICQLNLERDKGTIRPAPTGRDLRNTGAWYQRARVVMFVHRDQEIPKGTPFARPLPDGHVRVDKATHGDASEGYVEVTLNPQWMRFDRLDDYSAREAA